MWPIPFNTVPWALMLLLLVACNRTPPEQVLRQQVQQMEQAIEQREPARLLDQLADDFHGNGGMDNRALERLLKAQLLLNQRIEVVTGPLDVRIEGSTAQVGLTVVLAGGNGRLFENGRVHQLDTHWRDEGGTWRLYRAQWGDGRQP